jgi:gamma-glutamylcyclotransferase (GGCT)/AIG2-like uncharacterized protein YtfP
VDLLFVYGTLRSVFDNPYAAMLRANAGLIGRAVAPGSIFMIADYPGYRPEPPGEVHGELFRLHNPDAMFRILDDYEGPEYERVLIEGTGWIYQYRGRPDASKLIPSGDFCAR